MDGVHYGKGHTRGPHLMRSSSSHTYQWSEAFDARESFVTQNPENHESEYVFQCSAAGSLSLSLYVSKKMNITGRILFPFHTRARVRLLSDPNQPKKRAPASKPAGRHFSYEAEGGVPHAVLEGAHVVNVFSFSKAFGLTHRPRAIWNSRQVLI